MKDQQVQDILAFADKIGGAETTAFQKAVKRNWLDAEGAVTADGARLLDELDAQKATRTVFRGNF
jgi:hypothetical protein